MLHRIVLTGLTVLLCALADPLPRAGAETLFRYRALPQESGIETFGQWVRVLERHLLEDTPEGGCGENRFNRCHLEKWLAFLDSIRGRPRAEQIRAVNRYANAIPYVLDIDNYGVDDYWAIVREFLERGGDCEDYAITKFFSLRWLGLPTGQMRIVVLQDTNLRIPHAVLAVDMGEAHYILDNQIPQVVRDTQIVHYVPVYSINENGWWMYLPEGS